MSHWFPLSVVPEFYDYIVPGPTFPALLSLGSSP